MNLSSLRTLPEHIETEKELEDLLTCPSSRLVDFIKTISTPLVILGAGGKMGPTLAVLAKRAAEAASHSLEVIAVSRFGDVRARQWLESWGVKTGSYDLLDPCSFAQLPDSNNIIHLVGLKFGTAQNPAATWAINTIVPTRVAERYPSARIVVLSTGNVYPPAEVSRGGSLEDNSLTPLGEYANAAVARERVFEFHSRRQGTPIALLRLLYAVELRYGVLVDIARKVHAGEPIQLMNGYFNCIWQGDANEMALRALTLTESPPSVRNLCRPEIFSVRAAADQFGELMGRAPQFIGTEAPTALLANPARLSSRLGAPTVELETMLRWIAYWVQRDGRNLGKPTHFEVQDGKY